MKPLAKLSAAATPGNNGKLIVLPPKAANVVKSALPKGRHILFDESAACFKQGSVDLLLECNHSGDNIFEIGPEQAGKLLLVMV